MMNNSLSIIPAETGHLQKFIKHATETYATDMLKYGEFFDYPSAKKAAHNEVVGHLSDTQKPLIHRLYVVKNTKDQTRRSDEIVGYLWFVTNSDPSKQPREGFLNYLWVAGEQRKQKIGTEMMDFFEHKIRHIYQCTQATLYVFQENQPALALYLKRGYQIIKSAGPFNQAKTRTRFYLCKHLRP